MSEREFQPHPNDSEWLKDFDAAAEKEFGKLEADIGEIDEKIEYKITREETYRKLLFEYADIEDSERIEFLGKVSKFIEENKTSEDIRTIAKVRGYQDMLSDLMQERG